MPGAVGWAQRLSEIEGLAGREETRMTSGSNPRWEAAWLRLAVRPVKDEAAVAEARTLAAGGGPWVRLLARFEAEVLVPQAQALIAPLGSAAPDELRLPLAAAFRAHQARTLVLMAELREALQALAGLEVLAFKGPALAQVIHGDPGGRAYTDVDLLVHREDRLRAGAALKRIGFEPLWPVAPGSASALRHSSAVSFVAPGHAELDLHWGLSTPLLRFELERCGLWKRSRVVRVDGLALRTLGPEDTLLHVCMHAAKPDWTLWSSLSDIAGLLHAERDLDIRLLGELASRTGTRRLLRVALQLAATEAAAPLPGALGTFAFGDKVARRIAGEVRTALEDGKSASQAISTRLRRTLCLRERPQDKAHALLGAVARASEPRAGEHWPLWASPLRRPLRLLRDLRSDARPPLGGVGR